MELTLLRHAAPPLAYHGCHIGHTDIDIDERLFDYDKVQPVTRQHYDAVYSSDLRRCTATLKRMGIENFILDARLREVRFKPGIEGKTFAEIEKQGDFDPHFLNSPESWHRYVCDESRESFRSRIRSFLDELPQDSRVLLCTHAGTIAMIFSILKPMLPPLSFGYQDHTRLIISIG